MSVVGEIQVGVTRHVQNNRLWGNKSGMEFMRVGIDRLSGLMAFFNIVKEYENINMKLVLRVLHLSLPGS